MDSHRHEFDKDSNSDSDFTQGGLYALSGKVMLTSVITLFIIVLLIVCFHVYARWFVRRAHHHHRRRLFNRAAATITSRLSLSSDRGGLSPSLLNSIPTFTYSKTPASAATSSPPLECPVCLSEFEDGETGRVLPKCGHTFHVECIDTWFKSRSSCPLCRAPVRIEPGHVNRVRISEPGSSEMRLPAPIECRPKAVELEGIVVECRNNDGSNSRVDEGLSLKRFGSVTCG